MLDADGSPLGVYRKSHIPDGPGYQEKYYFRPGDTGFKVWSTRFGRVGVGICWDQWYPETARAMMLQPKVLVADEPTSALDVSIQAQVLNLFMDLQEQFNTGYVFISHNLSVVRHVADDVLVMYLGRPVEMGPSEQIYQRPLHPYTQALLSATPTIHPDPSKPKIKISGELPNPLSPPSGCAFHQRCPHASERCQVERPALRLLDARQVACHHAELING
jgi:dipeptide transport system ATP-binding protein